MTKLLISLPLSDAAQKYYGSTALKYNKVGDAGIDLPFIRDVKPYDVEVVETIGVISFETVFAMYDLNIQAKRLPSLEQFFACADYIWFDNIFDNLSIIQRYYLPSHFDIRPRSSIGKTPFRLANCVGTIDETYRGLVTNFPNQPYRKIGHPDILEADKLGAYLDYHPQLGIKGCKSWIDAGDRLLQIVAPNLDDIIWVRLDFTEENCQNWQKVIGNKNRGGFGTTNG